MAECLKEITLQALWQCEITEQEEEEYINDQVVPLNHMVRESYLKYLKQVLAKNLNMCSDTSNIYAQHDIEKCAGLLELKAFRLCMVTSLYQKAMLQMVADIKWHTKASKMYHKFEEIMSENCICKVSKCKATQTDLLEVKLEDSGNNTKQHSVNIKTEVPDEKQTNNFPSDCVNILCPPSFSLSSGKDFNDPCITQDLSPISNSYSPNNSNNELEISEKSYNCAVANECHRDDIQSCKVQNSKILQQNEDKTLASSVQNEARDSFDKTNFIVNSNASNTSPLNNSNLEKDGDEAIKQLKWILTDDNSKSEFGEALLYETATQELIRILESEGELSEEDTCNNKPKTESRPQSCKNESVDHFWTTQKHLQKTKLHENISRMCCNPDAKVKMKNKFFDMFGFDSEEDDVWCSKEKISQYKQKIAPTVVKHLLPYYKQKRILGRHVFKRVASHITDKLVCYKHFPDETDIEKGITLFFSYHGFIGKPEDVWPAWDRELH